MEADDGAEIGGIGEVEEDEGGDEGVGGGSADGDGGPEAGGLLEVGEVAHGPIDGGTLAGVELEGAEAEGGGEGIAPATIGFLGGEEGVDQLLVDGVMGLGELVEADEGEGGGREGSGELDGEAVGGFRPGDEELAGEAVILAGGPITIDLANCLHGGHPFHQEFVRLLFLTLSGQSREMFGLFLGKEFATEAQRHRGEEGFFTSRG